MHANQAHLMGKNTYTFLFHYTVNTHFSAFSQVIWKSRTTRNIGVKQYWFSSASAGSQAWSRLLYSKSKESSLQHKSRCQCALRPGKDVTSRQVLITMLKQSSCHKWRADANTDRWLETNMNTSTGCSYSPWHAGKKQPIQWLAWQRPPIKTISSYFCNWNSHSKQSCLPCVTETTNQNNSQLLVWQK